jgi:uncharacterized protein YqeY
LEEDMKNAMREREKGKFRLSVIRMVRASIKNLEIDQKHELNDEETLAVLNREVKMRRDSLEEFTKAQREDLMAQSKAEIEILMGYLTPKTRGRADGKKVSTLVKEQLAKL